ncbi:MAG TPA: DUF6174 domain-containing protein [Roseiflexaceae bacterium]|nr:DUF6174 domain-containing protein [Roseiflexaceae bacterium]
MMFRQLSPPRRSAAALLALLALACPLAALAAYGPLSPRARALAAAEARWRARPFAAYVMSLEELNCGLDVEVRDERVVRAALWSRCQRDARTVSELFALVRRDGARGARCITQGCACDDRLRVDAEFDPALGYPRRIEVRVAAEPNWLHLDTWRYMAANGRPPACAMMQGDKLIRVLALTPLQ